jgi:hypothetical protein
VPGAVITGIPAEAGEGAVAAAIGKLPIDDLKLSVAVRAFTEN